jgi:hypothetical protein
MNHTRATLFLVVLSVLAASSRTLSAHHYYASAYDASKLVQITGTVTRIDWTNPHVHIYVEAKDDDGRMVTWVCETGSPGDLSRRGLPRTELKPGDTFTVAGFRAKGERRAILIRKMTLADGRVIPGSGS